MVLAYLGKDNKGNHLWQCVCDCGQQVVKYTLLLRTGKAKSCGCLRRETSAAHCIGMSTHGDWGNGKATPEWEAWFSMRQRCERENHAQWKDYGGRGIKVCVRWETFENFLEDMGRRPGKGYSLDRRDNSKGYDKENCRWATYVEQNNNRRSNHRIQYGDRTQTVTEWCRELGVSEGRFRQAAGRSGNFEEAFANVIDRLAGW